MYRYITTQWSWSWSFMFIVWWELWELLPHNENCCHASCIFWKKCVSMLGITRTDENCCHTMRIMGREMNTLFFPKIELLPCLIHLGYDIVIPSIHVLGKAEHMDKFNSMPNNKFFAFQTTNVCRNFQTTSSKPSFYLRFITIMNVFLDIIMV